MSYVAMIHSGGRHWLLMCEGEDEVYEVQGWSSRESAVKLFEDMYARSASTNGLNSTAVSWLFFQPYLFEIRDESELEELVVNDPVLTAINSVGGHMRGIEIRPDKADMLVTRSVRPRLVT